MAGDTGTFLSKFLYQTLPKFFGTSDAGVGGTLDVDTTSAGTPATTAETDLWTYTLPANYLGRNGSTLRITAWGGLAANGNNKTVRGYFGGSEKINSGVVTTNAGQWRITMIVTRTAAAAQVGICDVLYAASGGGTNFISNALVGTSDTTATIAIKVTGQNGSSNANDVTFTGAIVEALN